MDFTCNVCGKQNTAVERFGREDQNCAECRSTVRIRALMYALSQELFGAPLQLRDFPVLKGLRTVGMTDSPCYANTLAEKFEYTNTFFDRAPRLDITAIESFPECTVDVLISSEVFEHVRPPVEKALENAFHLLGPNGFLLLTVPYTLNDSPSREHFPKFADAGFAQLNSGMVLVNRTAEGELQVFDNLMFHLGPGAALEMRVLNEGALRSALQAAGFTSLQFYGQDYPPFGIFHAEQWSLPVVARKQPFEFGAPLRSDLMLQYGQLHEKIRCAQAELLRHRAEYETLSADFEARTQWATSLDQDVRELRHAIERLEAELEIRTTWAQDLERQLAESNQCIAEEQSQIEDRTKWALDLAGQLEERTKWALDLDAWSKELDTELTAIRARWWTRLGRRLRVLP